MTKDDIILMAREAGLIDWFNSENDEYIDFANCLDKFAALVAAHEREACAKVCDDKVNSEYATGKVDHNEMGWTQACAIAIRARGQA
jgi:hypothetical protein